jgi:hypothetical protein
MEGQKAESRMQKTAKACFCITLIPNGGWVCVFYSITSVVRATHPYNNL